MPSYVSQLAHVTLQCRSHIIIIIILVLICAEIESVFKMDLSGSSDDDEPRRDQTERKAEARKELKKAVEGGVELLDWLLEFPALWEDPDLKEFHGKTYSITGDPKMFLP